MRLFERVTFAVWADRTTQALHIDVPELGTRFTKPHLSPRQLACHALVELRLHGVDGLIIAHLQGLGARGRL